MYTKKSLKKLLRHTAIISKIAGLVKDVKNSVKASSMYGNIVVLAGGTAASQVASIAVTPVLTRLYAPDDFGIMGGYLSIVGIVAVIASLRYELAVLIADDEIDAKALVALSMFLVIGNVAFVSAFLWFFGQSACVELGLDVLLPYITFVPVGMFLAACYNVLNHFAIREKEFTAISKSRVLQKISGLSAKIGFGFAYFGPAGLLIGDLVGRVLSIRVMLSVMLDKGKVPLEKLTVGRIRRVAWRYRRFPAYSTFVALINTLGVYLPILLMISIYGRHSSGCFSLTMTVVGVPMSIVGTSVGQAYLGEISRLAKTDPARVKHILYKTTRYLAIVSVGPFLVLSVGAPVLFMRVFGVEWMASGIFMRIMAPAIVFKFITVPVGHNLSIFERQDVGLVLNVGRLLGILTIFGIANALCWKTTTALSFLSAYMVLSYFVLFLLSVYVIPGNPGLEKVPYGRSKWAKENQKGEF